MVLARCVRFLCSIVGALQIQSIRSDPNITFETLYSDADERPRVEDEVIMAERSRAYKWNSVHRDTPMDFVCSTGEYEETLADTRAPNQSQVSKIKKV